MSISSLHDHSLASLEIDASHQVIRLRTVGEAAEAGTAEFTGVAAYHFDGDALGTIINSISETDPLSLYEAFAAELQSSWKTNGGHAPWVADPAAAKAFISAHTLRGFELSSSVGMAGAIWCRAASVVSELVPRGSGHGAA